jgi:hypothetical protein
MDYEGGIGLVTGKMKKMIADVYVQELKKILRILKSDILRVPLIQIPPKNGKN